MAGKGATTLGQRLSTRVKEIVKEHHKPLDPDKLRQVQEILGHAQG